MVRSNKTTKDAIAIGVLFVLTMVLAQRFELFEAFFELSREHEEWQVDEVLTAFILLALAFGVFAFRRWLEAKREAGLRRIAEEHLKGVNESLQRHALDLTQANRTLRERNEENEMFVYSVSHDLRSPLVNLQGFSQELRMVGEDLRELLDDEGLPHSVRERGVEMIEEDMGTSIRFIETGVSCALATSSTLF